MNLKELQEKFDLNNIIRFKLYSLEYVIEKKDECIVAYAIDYSTRKSKYNSFKEVINNFKVYNEPLIEQLDRIKIIE